MKHLLTWAGWLLVTTVVVAAPPRYPIKGALAVPPVIDGQVTTEPVWMLKELGGALTLNGTGRVPSQATRFGLVHDQKHLYVAFVCHEDQPERLKARRDRRGADLRGEDVVEVFLAPNTEAGQWFRFTVNAAGVLSEAANWDRSFRTRTVVAARRTPEGWCAELRIPLVDLRLDMTVSAVWRVNLVRREQPHGELSAWAPWSEERVDTAQFGLVADIAADWPLVVREGLWARALHIQSQAAWLAARARPYRGFGLAHTVSYGAEQCLKEVGMVGKVARQWTPPPEDLALAAALATRLEARLMRLQVLGARLDLLGQGPARPLAICELRGHPASADRPPTIEPLRQLVVELKPGARREISLVVVPLAGALRQLAVNIHPGPGQSLVASCEPDPTAEQTTTLPLTGLQPYRLVMEAPPSLAAGTYTATLAITASRVDPVTLPVVIRVAPTP